ncbi:MAG: hypothetical protein ACYC4U_29175 [Pirellulaceae bacterium]
MDTTSDLYRQFAEALNERLVADDDPRLWKSVVEAVIGDATFLCQHRPGRATIFARIGRCSHWLSPHNNGSWLRDARFAWPSGYGGSGWSISGLPEFDWSAVWAWNAQTRVWEVTERIEGKRPLTLRVAVPARTNRHPRAVVHVLWTPGSPTTTTKKLLQAYGFELYSQRWELSAIFGDRWPYEVQ